VPPNPRRHGSGPYTGPRPHVGPPEAGSTHEDADFARVDWDWTELDSVTFVRCRFEDAHLLELVTRRCVFQECTLTGVRMAGGQHTGTAFLSCRFERARLSNSVFVACKLTGSLFGGADLRPLETRDCDWSWTSLRGVDLSGTDLSGQRFSEADLTDADLRECDLSRADLTSARVQSARFRGADLRGASTGGVDFRQVDLTGVRLDVLQAVQVARTYGALVED
jgi:uncharacterized protein YjbI with pentapeptide repeats